MGSPELVANELLAFIIYAIDTMDEISILQICKATFKEEEICSGKALLFKVLGKADQMPARRRDGGERSLQDIINLLKVTDPDDVPVAFCAKELGRLPSVPWESLNCVRMLKDITALKSSMSQVMSKLEASENTISELRAEVVSLRNIISVSRSPEATNINVHRGGGKNASSSFESAKFDSPPPAVVTTPPTDAPRPAPRAPTITSRVSASTPERAYAAIVARPTLDLTEGRREKLGHRDPVCNAMPLRTLHSKCDNDGFTKVERKKKKKNTSRNKSGTAPTGDNHLLRPELPSTQLYVSRLHYTTQVEDLVEYIALKTNMNLRVQRLESRHNVTFKSFVVRVPTRELPTFMEAEFWPKGVKFRRFLGRIPDASRIVSPDKK